MLNEREQQLSDVLDLLAGSLDIPPSKYKQAVDRYSAVGNWLSAQDSLLASDHPEVYPQGSFRLGTVVRPIRECREANYDIDLVCELQVQKSVTTPRLLKTRVGQRLHENGSYVKLMKPEGKRCWTLEYAEDDGIGFHLDVLPALPDEITVRRRLSFEGVGEDYLKYALAITQKDKQTGSYNWISSNPRGYATWFGDVNRPSFTRSLDPQKQMLFEANRAIFASVAEVPDALVRTPLQRAIQILKRHRDMRFAGHQWEDQKPISMIITTLAALSYSQEEDLYSALAGIIQRICDYEHSGVLQRPSSGWYLPNPVDPSENFADRWNESNSKRPEAFFTWLGWLRADLQRAISVSGVSEIKEALGPVFGERATGEAFGRYMRQPHKVTLSGIPVLTGSLSLNRFNVAHRQPAPWPIRLQCQARVEAEASDDGSRWFPIASDAPALPKEYRLRFRVRTNVPRPFEVFWQVVNTGEQARRENGLRGGIFAGECVNEERTLYTGMHWIQCFIVRNRYCLARSTEFVVNVQ